MKNQFLITCLAAALLAGCSKNEGNTPGGGTTPQSQISARAISRGDVGVGTKAPVTAPTLDGKQADVYTTVSPLHTYTGDKTRMFTDAYARGTMTFDDAVYVGYDAGHTGNTLLPQDGSVRYMYGFYPMGWTRAANAGNTFESLSFLFDGSHDVMCSWMTGDQDVQVKYRDATLPERGEFTFKHLLMRCDVQVQAKDADAATAWGRIRSVSLKDATINKVSTTEPLGYAYTVGGGGVSFFTMGGTDASRTYGDTAFEKTAFADMLPLTVDLQNACYSMFAPTTVDADSKTPELILHVVTLDKDGGRTTTTEIPVSLDQSKFTANANSTRGYVVTLQLNFRAGAIKALATVEEWKNGGSQNEDVDGTTPTIAIGDLKDGGIVYWIDPANKKNYKVFSLPQGSSLKWSAQNTYVLGAGDGRDATDGKKNMSAIKAYFEANKGTVGSDFSVAFPAAAYCDAMNTGGVMDWYLPAKDELKALYDAYNANKAVLDQALTDNSGTAIPASGYFWTSTEDSNIARSAWFVDFSNGYTDYNVKGDVNYVRCVRAM